VSEKQAQYTREVLVEQILWLIRLRWIAVCCLVAAGAVASVVFPVLTSAAPIYVCTGVLLLCNIVYFLSATKESVEAGPRDVVLGMVQLEADLVILTAVLHFAGGVVNPFVLYYIFHVIIATIILPRHLSYAVGLTAIVLFGALAVIELNGSSPFGYFPLQLAAGGGLWRNPVYSLGGFAAFSSTVILAQYLTRIIIVRMTAKEAEAARNHDVLKAVISGMGEGLMFVARDLKVAVCNPVAKRWKKADCTGKGSDVLDHFPTALAEHVEGLIGGAGQSTGGEQVIEFETEGPDARHIEARSCPVVGVNGQELGYVIVGQDLTEREELERDLVERTEEITAINEMLKMSRVKMAQREKMVAIGQMAAGIAHEIGNPLASLSSVAQYLGRKLKTHEGKEKLLVIEYQVNRISRILKRMLSLSRPATVEYKWVDINELIENTLSLLKFDRRMESITVNNTMRSDLPMVWLNPQNFEQVLLNVFINAMDAMSAKEGDGEQILEIAEEFKGGMVEVRVSDTGIGMNPEICKRAFESFFTTKEIGKGTGLGLFISYNLISEIDGMMMMESEPGKGTTVIMRIPVRPKRDLIAAEEGDGDSMDGIKRVKRDAG
jgi:signal transduction histidine kinase